MNPVPSTFPEVALALRRTVQSLVGAVCASSAVRIATYNPGRKKVDLSFGSDQFLVSLGPEWSWNEGEAMGAEGGSITLPEGQVFVEYWHRDERDEAGLSDQFMTDPLFSATGPLGVLLSHLNDDGKDASTLQDARGDSPLFRPLILQKLTTPQDIEHPWRSWSLAFNCQFQLRA